MIRREMLLTTPDGKSVKLTPERPSATLGRADVDVSDAGKFATYISRKHCKVTAQADGTTEVVCISKSNPTTVHRCAARGGQPLKLGPGDKCIIQPGDRIVLLEAEGLRVPAFELHIGDSDAAPAPAGAFTPAQPPAELKPSPATPGSSVADDVVPLATPPPALPNDAFDFVELPAKRRRSGEQQPAPAAGQPVAPVAPAGPSDRQSVASVHPSAPAKPVMVVLVGAPGSGKSTWAASLQQLSSVNWQRVNQDTVDGGKRGSRQQCVAMAKAALTAGTNVVIDRTNFDTAQRADFMKLAAELEVQAHCVVLHLDVGLCVKRAIDRTDHEGGLQGKNAKIAVYRMHSSMSKAGLPTASEGFESIMVCPTVRLVASALSAWAGYTGDAAAAVRQFDSAASKGSLSSMWGAAGAQRPPAAPAAGSVANAQGSSLTPAGGKGAGTPGGMRPSGATVALLSLALKSGGSAANTASETPATETVGASPAAATPPASLAVHAAATPPTTPQPGSSAATSSGAVVPSAGEPAAGAGDGPASPQPNAFRTMMSASRNAGAGSLTPTSPPRQPARKWGGPLLALYNYAMEPERFCSEFPDMVVDEQCISIPDKYPKAQHHRLVIARDPGLDSVDALRRDHIPLLHHMQEVGEQYIKGIGNAATAPFRMGFHAVPSMRQLHLHVISQDFNSPCLKNKKHWNSFTHPGFFLPAADVIQQLIDKGRLDVDHAAAEALLKEQLRCHRCGAAYQTLPALKTHLSFCAAPYPVWTWRKQL